MRIYLVRRMAPTLVYTRKLVFLMVAAVGFGPTLILVMSQAELPITRTLRQHRRTVVAAAHYKLLST